jgi:hypothetical protein
MAVGYDQDVPLQPGEPLGSGKLTTVAVPLPGRFEDDATPAGGTSHRVVVPDLPGTDPSHDRGGGRCPHHHRVVGIGDHHGSRAGVGVGDGVESPQHRPPLVDQHPDFGDPVELVPGQVEEHHHLGMGLLDELAQIPLIHLQHHRPRRPGPDERGHMTGRHVGAGGVGGHRHRTDLGQRRHQHPGGGGLTVGSRHQRHVAVPGQDGQQIGVDGQAGPPADHRPTPAPELPGQPVDGRGHLHRHRGAEGEPSGRDGAGDGHAEGSVRASSSPVGIR